MDRRQFMAGASSIGLAGAAGTGFASTDLGTANLISISDGHLVLPESFVFDGLPAEEVLGIRHEFGVTGKQIEPECNLALYRDETRIVLFDVGSGPDFMPSAGKVTDSLEAIGLIPEAVTHVVFTHAHPDHIWGLLDDFDEPLFSEATYLMGRKEWDYWWNPSTVDEIGDARAAFAVGAKRRMEAIEDTVIKFDDGDEILPGIQAMASHGHTPGHMSFQVRQGNEAALIVGDAIGNHHVAFARPDWRSGSDQEPDAAIASRKMLLDRLASEQMRLIGFHLPNGGVGRVDRSDGAFRFIGENQ